MATISNPGAVAPVSAYRPVRYEAVSDTTTENYTAALVTVLDANSNMIGQRWVDWVEKSPVAGGFRYKFRFDIAGDVRALLYPLPNERTATALTYTLRNLISPSSAAEVSVRVEFYYRDATTNLVTDSGLEVISSPVVVFATARQHSEAQGMGVYVDTAQRKLLHDLPTSALPICTDEAFSLSFVHHADIVTGRLVVLQTNGVTDTAYWSVGQPFATALSNKRVHVCGVGPRNLNAIPPAAWANSFNIEIDETIASYTVDFGSGSGGTYLQLTAQAKFKVEKVTPSRLRLHWLNDRGAFDAFTFDAVLRNGRNANADYARRPLAWTNNVNPHDVEQREVLRIDTTTALFWEVESRYLLDDVAAYVAQIVESQEVYLEDASSKYYPVTVSDGKVIGRDNEQTGIIIRLVVTHSALKINTSLW